MGVYGIQREKGLEPVSQAVVQLGCMRGKIIDEPLFQAIPVIHKNMGMLLSQQQLLPDPVLGKLGAGHLITGRYAVDVPVACGSHRVRPDVIIQTCTCQQGLHGMRHQEAA